MAETVIATATETTATSAAKAPGKKKVAKSATKSKRATVSGAKKPKAARSYPSFYEMISVAIVTLKEKTGSSQHAITKFIEEKHKQLPSNFRKLLLVQLKRLVASGKLVKVKNSFKLAKKEPADSKPKRKTTATTTTTTTTKKAVAKQKPKSKAKVATAVKPKKVAKAKPATKPKPKAKGTKRPKPKTVAKPAKVAKTAAKSSPGKKLLKAAKSVKKAKTAKSATAKKVTAKKSTTKK